MCFDYSLSASLSVMPLQKSLYKRLWDTYPYQAVVDCGSNKMAAEMFCWKQWLDIIHKMPINDDRVDSSDEWVGAAAAKWHGTMALYAELFMNVY